MYACTEAGRMPNISSDSAKHSLHEEISHMGLADGLGAQQYCTNIRTLAHTLTAGDLQVWLKGQVLCAAAGRRLLVSAPG